jgi:threonine/homoserine/homoserine lactone efflux protein
LLWSDGVMDPSIVLAFVAACVVISIVPGPDMMFIIAHGIARGRRAGVIAALGMSSGIIGHTIAAALGLSAVITAAPMVLDVVRIVGAVILVYLAISALRSTATTVTENSTVLTGRSLRRTYVMALLTNLSNPKMILFYVAFVPQFVTADSGWSTPVQFLVLGGILVVVGLLVDASVGVLAGSLAALLLRRPAVRRWLNRLSAAIFGALAVRLIVDQ